MKPQKQMTGSQYGKNDILQYIRNITLIMGAIYKSCTDDICDTTSFNESPFICPHF